MSDTRANDGEAANASDDAGKMKPGATEADEAKAMEDAQKEAAEEHEEDGGYQ